MKKIAEYFPGAIYFILISLYLIGTVHAFKKHGTRDGLIGAVLFPWSIYRGAECFWHDDFAGTDWSKQLKRDMENSIYALNDAVSTDKAVTEYELNKNIQELSDQILKYPKEKQDYLGLGVKTYIESQLSLVKDMEQAFLNKVNNNWASKEVSAKTRQLETSLENDYKVYKIKEAGDSVLLPS